MLIVAGCDIKREVQDAADGMAIRHSCGDVE